jgi:hypothetical protein
LNIFIFFILVALIFALVMSFLVWEKIQYIKQTTFIDLEKSFLKGKVYLLEPVCYSFWQDTAFLNGKHYCLFWSNYWNPFYYLSRFWFFNFSR